MQLSILWSPVCPVSKQVAICERIFTCNHNYPIYLIAFPIVASVSHRLIQEGIATTDKISLCWVILKQLWKNFLTSDTFLDFRNSPQGNALLIQEIIYRVYDTSGFCTQNEKVEKHSQSRRCIYSPFYLPGVSCCFEEMCLWVDKACRRNSSWLAEKEALTPVLGEVFESTPLSM